MSVEQKIAELLAENEEVPTVDNDIDEELQERIDEMSDDDLKNFLVSEEFSNLDEMVQGKVNTYASNRQSVVTNEGLGVGESWLDVEPRQHKKLTDQGYKINKKADWNDKTPRTYYLHPETLKVASVDAKVPFTINHGPIDPVIKYNGKPVKFNQQMESIDVTADMLALTEGENLTEEFKEKAAIIFEAAIVNRVKEELTRINEEYQVKLTEEVDQIKEGLVEQIDGYLDYVVEQWMEQNEIALDQGMKSEILEGFIGGLKSLFEDHYIDVPEEKYDVLEAMQQELQELHTTLDEQVNVNVSLNNKITGLKVKSVADSLAEDLTMTDKTKFFNLIEDLEVDSVESFQKKAQTIKESYFNKKPAKSQVGSFVSDSPILTEELAETYVAPEMKSYVSVLNTMSKL